MFDTKTIVRHLIVPCMFRKVKISKPNLYSRNSVYPLNPAFLIKALTRGNLVIARALGLFLWLPWESKYECYSPPALLQAWGPARPGAVQRPPRGLPWGPAPPSQLRTATMCQAPLCTDIGPEQCVRVGSKQGGFMLEAQHPARECCDPCLQDGICSLALWSPTPMLQGPHAAARWRTSHPETPRNLLFEITRLEMQVQAFSGRERTGAPMYHILDECFNHCRGWTFKSSSDFACVLWNAFWLKPLVTGMGTIPVDHVGMQALLNPMQSSHA